MNGINFNSNRKDVKELKVILLLSEFVRRLKEGEDYEKLTYETSEKIVESMEPKFHFKSFIGGMIFSIGVLILLIIICI